MTSTYSLRKIGGISFIGKRYSKVNNKHMKNYYHKKPSKSITYLDMNHFYGWAMSDYLPYGEFKWLKNANNLDVNSISEKSPIGYIVEVGLNILVNCMYCKIIVH